MPRPFTRAQAVQNAAFLDILARTGNMRLSAREAGVHRSTYTKRRARSAAFAEAWNAALAAAHARFDRSGGARPPEPEARGEGGALRTSGGEPTIVRRLDGSLQLREALPGWMTATAEAAFLARLRDTANIRMSAAEAGLAHSIIFDRARRNPPFAEAIVRALVEARPGVERAAREATEEAFRQAERNLDARTGWPEGLTIADALRLLGAPPLKLPGTPSPGRRKG